MIRVFFISPLMLLGFFFNSSFKSNFINVFSFFNFLVLLFFLFWISACFRNQQRISSCFGGNSFEFQALQLVVGLLLSLLRKKKQRNPSLSMVRCRNHAINWLNISNLQMQTRFLSNLRKKSFKTFLVSSDWFLVHQVTSMVNLLPLTLLEALKIPSFD